MSRQRFLLLLGIAFLLLLAALGGGAWWYLFGTNEIESAELVPANTIFFASIPNAATLLEGYQTSQAKTLLESPNLQSAARLAREPARAKKCRPASRDFAPNLSGQSFLAVTHFDYDHPEKVGLIAAMKPKAGLGDFGTFVEKIKAAWPDVIKQGKTGTGTRGRRRVPVDPGPRRAGQRFAWRRSTAGSSRPGARPRCRIGSSGTRAGPAPPVSRRIINYVKAIGSVGDAPMTLLYINYHLVIDILQQADARRRIRSRAITWRRSSRPSAARRWARGLRSGEIVDRFSLIFPASRRRSRLAWASGRVAFDTLKFTGPDTRFYWASTINWKQYAKNLRDQGDARPRRPARS